MSKNTLLFDLDNTLTDYDYTNKYAIKQIYKEIGRDMSDDDYKEFSRFENNYWSHFEHSNQSVDNHGLSRIDYVRSNLYQEFFGYDLISLEFALHLMYVYINNLGVVNKVFEDVPDTIEYLYDKYDLYIASNGPEEAQIRKLKGVDLLKYFKGVVSSENALYSKPKKEFYDYIFSKYGLDVYRCAFIGDSLKTDILGANNYNMYSIWYNRNHIVNDTNIRPDIEINNMQELKKIL